MKEGKKTRKEGKFLMTNGVEGVWLGEGRNGRRGGREGSYE